MHEIRSSKTHSKIQLKLGKPDFLHGISIEIENNEPENRREYKYKATYLSGCETEGRASIARRPTHFSFLFFDSLRKAKKCFESDRQSLLV